MERETDPTLEEFKTLQQKVEKLEKRLERLELRNYGLPQDVVCLKTDDDLNNAKRALGYMVSDYGISKPDTYWLLSINHIHAEILAEAGIPMYNPPREGEEPTDQIDPPQLVEELKEYHNMSLKHDY